MSEPSSVATPTPPADLVLQVVREYPEPIADLVAQWSACRAPRTADAERVLVRLVHAFEGTIHLLGILAVAEFARAAQSSSHGAFAASPARKMVSALSNPRPLTLGFWRDAVGMCLSAFEDRKELLFCPELYEFRVGGPKGRGGALHQQVEDSVSRRNKLYAHAYHLDASQITETLVAQEAALLDLLDSLQFLSKYRLVRAVEVLGDGRVLLEERVGSAWAGAHHPVQLAMAEAPITGRVYWTRPAGTEPWPAMSMHPLVVAIAGDEAEAVHVALYAGAESERLQTHIRVRTSQRSSANYAVELRALSPENREPDAAREHRLPGDVPVGHIVDCARRESQAFLDRARRENVYVSEAYIDRSRSSRYVDEWRAGEPRGLLLLTGMAGAGKTSLLCRATEVLLASSGRDAVLLLSASELPQDPGEVARAIARRLGADKLGFDGLLAAWEGVSWKEKQGTTSDVAPGRILILVDALDRAPFAAGVLRALLSLVTKTGPPALRILATVALPVLEGLPRELVQGPHVQRHAEGPAGGHAIVVDPLSPDEVERGYDTYRNWDGRQPRTQFNSLSAPLRAAMQNPLLLRLTCQAFDKEDIPPEAGEIDVLRRYAERECFAGVPRRDFVRRLVEAMAPSDRKTLRRRIPMAELLRDPCLRDGILAPDGPFRALLEGHVLSEVLVPGARRFATTSYEVEFTFDALLGYLVYALDESSDADDKLAAYYADRAGAFAPMGYSLDLALRSLWLDRLARGGDRWFAALLGPLFASANESLSAATARLLEWVDAQAPLRWESLGSGGNGGLPKAFADEIRESLTVQMGLELEKKVLEPSLVQGLVEELAAVLDTASLVQLAQRLRGRGALLLAATVSRGLLAASTPLPAAARWESEHVLAEACFRNASDDALTAARARLEDLVGKGVAGGDDAPTPALVASVLHLLARIAMERQDFAAAGDHVSSAIAKGRKPWDEVDLAFLKLTEVTILTQQGPAAAARHAWREAQERIAALGQRRTAALQARSDLTKPKPDPEDALAFLERVERLQKAAAGFRGAGDLLGAAEALAAVAEALRDGEEAEQKVALKTAREARRLASSIGATAPLLRVLYVEAGIYGQGAGSLRDFPAADAAIREHARVAWESGRLMDLQFSLRGWGLNRSEEGDNYAAVQATRMQLKIIEHLESAGYKLPEKHAAALANLSCYERKCGLLAEALASARRSAGIARDIPDELNWSRLVEADVLIDLAGHPATTEPQRDQWWKEGGEALSEAAAAAELADGGACKSAGFILQWTQSLATWLHRQGRGLEAAKVLYDVLSESDAKPHELEGLPEAPAYPRLEAGGRGAENATEVWAWIAWVVCEVRPTEAFAIANKLLKIDPRIRFRAHHALHVARKALGEDPNVSGPQRREHLRAVPELGAQVRTRVDEENASLMRADRGEDRLRVYLFNPDVRAVRIAAGLHEADRLDWEAIHPHPATPPQVPLPSASPPSKRRSKK